jgi:FAD/FMN-containing dehydrogenase/Fe-S oxidoreductase
MLPRITPDDTLENSYYAYIKNLRETIFSGEIHTDYAARLAVATDNSIYQIIPQAVIHPRNTQDLEIALTLSHTEKYREHITFSPRGGGTGTNGQSLSSGIIVDCSKFMHSIIELNLEEQWVQVQPGVVLDQLNQYLQPYGFYFAPQVSTSSRATLGGMINTDACGNGSRLLGRTSDHVVELTCVLHDGSRLETQSPSQKIKASVTDIIQKNTNFIQEKFSNAPRTLTGYNLWKGYQGELNLNYIFSGSEGTLGIIGECKLKITPIPKFKKLILIKYRSFDDALRAEELNSIKPQVIETIDSKLLSLARQDSIYHHLKNILDGDDVFPQSINLVGFAGDDETELHHIVRQLCETINTHKRQAHHAIGYYIAKDSTEMKLLWELRKKSVGLISKELIGARRPIPFIEDTAVPPERLADYISEFKALLDSYNLIYGMYGHVDAGCIHIRPALDMQNTDDEKIMRELSDKVVALLEKYQGVMWGEHGKGFRTEYTENFFGAELYLALREIKTLFDPNNQLNPGKIVTPLNSTDQIVALAGPLRGHFDKQIPANIQKNYASAMLCNGNGACFNDASQETMCPSFKVTRDRIQSPKGRAGLVREWLRQLTLRQYDLKEPAPKTYFFQRVINSLQLQPDFSTEVYQAMTGCLSCKACATQCPLKVDVPEFKAKFLSHYYRRYLRPLRDYVIGATETWNPIFAKFPRIYNRLVGSASGQALIEKMLELVHTPRISTPTVKKGLASRKAAPFDMNVLQTLSAEKKSKSVIILQDTFTTFYEAELPLKIYDLLRLLGFDVYVAPIFPNGKPLHVKGFLDKFNRLVTKNAVYLNQLSALDIPIIGIDPSITLTYRDEYQKVTGQVFPVQLPQEWLVKNLEQLVIKPNTSDKQYYLLSHCTEKTACVAAEEQWQTIFSAFGCELKPLAAGCCGMAGSYGHELEHAGLSYQLFKMDWLQHLENNPEHRILATGYSCRSRAGRSFRTKPSHPLAALFDRITLPEDTIK